MNTKRMWKLGDPCFILDMSVGMTHASMRVMPAIITHVGSTSGTAVIGTSFSTAKFGEQFVEGRPFVSEREAREWALGYARRVVEAAQNAPLEGVQPGWNIPEYLPQNGDVVYTLDADKQEILQVAVGMVRLEFGVPQVGYDPSPGNPECSVICMHKWWATRAEAEEHARRQHGETFAFITKEELAARTNAGIEEIFETAKRRLESPEHKNGGERP